MSHGSAGGFQRLQGSIIKALAGNFPPFLPFPCGGIQPGPNWSPHPIMPFILRWMVMSGVGGVIAVTMVTLPSNF